MARYGNPLPPWAPSPSHFHVEERRKSKSTANKHNVPEQKKLPAESGEFFESLDGLVQDANNVNDDDNVDDSDYFDDDEGVDDTDDVDMPDASDLPYVDDQHILDPDIDPALYNDTNDQQALHTNIDPILYGNGNDYDQYVSGHPGRFGEADLHPPTSENFVNGHGSYDTDTKLLPPSPPAYLHQRTSEVLLYFAGQVLTEMGVCITPPPVRLPDMSVDGLTEIWHRTRAQLLADGVPSELILVGGLRAVSQLLSFNRGRFYDPSYVHALPQWSYCDKSKDAPSIEVPSGQLASNDHGQHEQLQDGDGGLVEYHDDREANPQPGSVWPPDRGRHEALTLTNESVFVISNGSTKNAPTTLRAPAQLQPPSESAQHRSSTLRILLHIMRKLHRTVFGVPKGSYAEFWTTLFVSGLDQSWKIKELSYLKQRFQWVLDLVETGCLPPQAQIAENLLREGLKDSALSCTSHPYDYVIRLTRNTAGYLNPDLSATWVKKFLSAEGALQHIEAGIQTSIPDMGIDGFCGIYGILIAWIWEESIHQSGNWRKDEDVTSFAYLVDTMPTEPSEPPEAERQKTSTPPPLAPGFPVLESRPDSPGPYPPLRDETIQGISKAWEPQEYDYLKYLEGAGYPRATRNAKFWARFGPHREATAIDSKMKQVRKDQPRRVPLWTDREKQYLIELLETKQSWKEVHAAFSAKFPESGRDIQALRFYANKNELTIPWARTVQPWTDLEDAYLETLIKDKVPMKQIPAMLKEKSGIIRTESAVRSRVTTLELRGDNKHEAFTEREDKFLRKCLPLELDSSELYSRFRKQFGDRHPSKSIQGRMKRVATDENASTQRFVPWEDREIEFLEDWARRPVQTGVVKEFQAVFGPNRSELAVKGKLNIIRTRQKNTATEDTQEDG
ncbi:uncharacterized protein B0J16DRAFT_397313 [Fusarium flagelliforme]|uniref:Homeodomain-like protein n=1 Tax=Fusarium flagelliforme TaxID=2675880 RepID=A0A395MPU1_9HYPO|nr:uncharacterized protein B0J16DRAFT_397313 [Fusarium flagelliforme]KAH7189312.1 hypothetical protein B0J16DRAFT_397313 [Fusarium flagelliforme]RFN49575.1 homeodomain-like protein [Fusarium flagelliforme]